MCWYVTGVQGKSVELIMDQHHGGMVDGQELMRFTNETRVMKEAVSDSRCSCILGSPE